MFAGVCVCVCLSVWDKERDETEWGAIHLFFLVEALSVTVGYAEAPRIEYVADLEPAQDALHLSSTRPLATWQTARQRQRYTLVPTQPQATKNTRSDHTFEEVL